jgi:hypothetical protein
MRCRHRRRDAVKWSDSGPRFLAGEEEKETEEEKEEKKKEAETEEEEE